MSHSANEPILSKLTTGLDNPQLTVMLFYIWHKIRQGNFYMCCAKPLVVLLQTLSIFPAQK